ncbi:unnamed protein product [Rhodiola kirilowii]
METSETAKPVIEVFKNMSKQATFLWLEGFREALLSSPSSSCYPLLQV